MNKYIDFIKEFWWIGAIAFGVMIAMGVGLLFYENFRIHFKIRNIVPRPTGWDIAITLILGWAFVLLILASLIHKFVVRIIFGNPSGST